MTKPVILPPDEQPSSSSGRGTEAPAGNVMLDVAVKDTALGAANDLQTLMCEAAIAALAYDSDIVAAPLELYIAIVGDDESQTLNRDYRDKDRPTNVLSFPGTDAEDLAAAAEVARAGGPPLMLGDIIICAPVLVREAKEQNKTPSDHLKHMIIHGVLHVLGYDHIDDADAEEMEAIERALLAGLGVADPYEKDHGHG